ncbi:MAG: hypothetical protein KA941_05215 [Flavobacteriales bacterium]|nr:hypothetical protein [Flavobacteriales bacterium]
MQRILLVLLYSTVSAQLCAQIATNELAAVNDRFAGAVQVKIDRRDNFIFDFFDANGRFRQDVVPVEQLDAHNLHYSVEEDAVILACKGEFPQCISKEIFKLNTIRATGRSNLSRPASDDGGAASMEALRVLVVAAQEQLVALGETREAPPRRK